MYYNKDTNLYYNVYLYLSNRARNIKQKLIRNKATVQKYT